MLFLYIRDDFQINIANGYTNSDGYGKYDCLFNPNIVDIIEHFVQRLQISFTGVWTFLGLT